MSYTFPHYILSVGSQTAASLCLFVATIFVWICYGPCSYSLVPHVAIELRWWVVVIPLSGYCWYISVH